MRIAFCRGVRGTWYWFARWHDNHVPYMDFLDFDWIFDFCAKGPFLQFSSPKSNANRKKKKNKSAGHWQANKILHSVSLIDILCKIQNYWTVFLSRQQQQLYGPVNCRDFRETAQRPEKLRVTDRRHCMMSLYVHRPFKRPLKACSMTKDPLDCGYCHGLAGKSPFLESPCNFRARRQILKSKLVQQ